ncbi:MAG: efflux RND transporter permease subunit [Planctomycetes bacterium]|nr:efflux RND transporter permease subunit [Planctomycetota bacterium]
MRGRNSFTARVVEKFLTSRLSLLLVIATLAAGAVGFLATPREEEPQIVVPMVDVYISFPGATAEEVEKLVTTNLETKLLEIEGVEHVYSMSRPGEAVVMLRFLVGRNREDALTNTFAKIQGYVDQVPPGVAGWIVRPVDVDDIPILTVTLHGGGKSDFELRRIADEVLDHLQRVPNSSKSYAVGGRRREIRVTVDPAALASRNLSPLDVNRALGGANAARRVGNFTRDNAEILVSAGPFLRDRADVESVVLSAAGGRLVYVKDVAKVTDGPEDALSYTRIGFGPAAERSHGRPGGPGVAEEQSVTIAVAKRKNTNAVWVAEDVQRTIRELSDQALIPPEVTATITRDYGHSADEKVNELAGHIAAAVLTVVVVIVLGLGWRAALVVALAVPLTLSIALVADLLVGYTINRVTLFALVLSLGLLVDDPIVDVENIHRHFMLMREPPLQATLTAVNEVRPPLIMATLTVVVSFLPMFFVTGMMGPYMRPMPFNVPVVMLGSLVVALTVTPWVSYHFLKGEYGKHAEPFDVKKSFVYRAYRRLMGPLLDRRPLGSIFLLLMILAFFGAVSLALVGLVPMKMLPFDNRNEMQVVVDMPEGSTLEETDRVAVALGEYFRTVPEVADYQVYVGTASPHDMNGMARHYFLRGGPAVADVRVNFLHKKEREQQSHTIALRLRNDITRIGERFGANLKIVEVPPGPPVLATVVAEVYPPLFATWEETTRKARLVTDLFRRTAGVVDVDDMIEEDQIEDRFVVDREKAALAGISQAEAVAVAEAALRGVPAGTVQVAGERLPLGILVRLDRADRSGLPELLRVPVRGAGGTVLTLGDLGRFERGVAEKTIFHKDLRRVVFVQGETAGTSPVDAVLAMQGALEKDPLPEGYRVEMAGEGEWKITVDVFRDLGMAFAAALLGIYILLVAQTGSLLMPLIMMVSIPITMIGILPGFWLLNVLLDQKVGGFGNPIFFTATGMIGMIALSGIVVRNSIILIDFIQVLLTEGKVSARDAVIEAGAVRLKPILLTAGTSMMGTWVMVLDPIFSGLAWAFIFGIVASTFFTLLVVPLMWFRLFGKKPVVAPQALEAAP